MGFTLRFLLGLCVLLLSCCYPGSSSLEAATLKSLTVEFSGSEKEVPISNKTTPLLAEEIQQNHNESTVAENVNPLNNQTSKPKTENNNSTQTDIVIDRFRVDKRNNLITSEDAEEKSEELRKTLVLIRAEEHAKSADNDTNDLHKESTSTGGKQLDSSEEDLLHKQNISSTDEDEANKTSRDGAHRSIDIEKYVSKDFHNRNNVYTVPTSPDIEKYINPDYDYHSSTTYHNEDLDHVQQSQQNSNSHSSELTTPRTELFDNRYKAAVDSVDQTLEHIDENDSAEGQSTESHEDSETQQSEDSLDVLHNRALESDNNATLNYINFKNVVKNDNANKSALHKDLVVEEGTNLDFVSTYNHTRTYDEHEEEPSKENNTSSVEVHQDDIKNTKVTLIKPVTHKNNSDLLSNKIDTEPIKSVVKVENLTKIPPTVSTTASTVTTNKNDELHKLNLTNEQLVQENQVIPVHVTPANTDRATPVSVTVSTTPIAAQKISNSTLSVTSTTEGNSIIHDSDIDQAKIISTTTSEPITTTFSVATESMITTTEAQDQQRTTTEQPEETTATQVSFTGSEVTQTTVSSNNEESITSAPITSTEEPTEVVDTSSLNEPKQLCRPIKAKQSISDSTTTTTENPTTIFWIESNTSAQETTTTEGTQTTTEEPTPETTTPGHTRTSKGFAFSNDGTSSSSNSAKLETTTEISTTTQEAPFGGTEKDITARNTVTKLKDQDLSTSSIPDKLAPEDKSTEATVKSSSSSGTTPFPVKLVTNATARGGSTERPISSSASGSTSPTSSPTTGAASIRPETSSTTEVPVRVFTSTSTSVSISIKTTNGATTTVTTTTTTEDSEKKHFQYNVNASPATSNVEELTTSSGLFRHQTNAGTVDSGDGNMTTPPSDELGSDDGNNSGTIAAIVISSIGAVCLILLAGLLFIMRKRQKRFNYGQRCTPVSLDDYSMDNVSVYNSVRRKGAARASKRSHGNPAFEDPTSVSHPLNFLALGKFAANLEEITAEFEEIPQITARTNELPEGCDTKNRYANVIPLPETRVFLTPIEGYPTSDYINANYVTGPNNTKGYYIACQAPMLNTVDDFWRMIWEQQCKVILMITHLFENGVEKCVDYLPPSEVLDCHRLFGDFQVTLKKREVKDKYIISIVQLKNMVSNSWREVTHFWYLGWPDKGVPTEANSLIAFLIEARSYMKSSSLDRKEVTNGNLSNGSAKGDVYPVVVHCSPGTGRTGVVIACDFAIREFEKSRLVDIPRIVYKIRRDRASAVQTKDQYAFIYKVIALYATKLAGGTLDIGSF